jgi:hypothetical protein
MSLLAYYKKKIILGVELLFDAYPSTVPFFFIEKKISSDMSGHIVLVEEMTTNTTQGFSFAADGTFPTASVESFAGAGDARCRRLYEAKGDGSYIDFGTGTQQPFIVESGSLVTLNSQPSLRFTGTEFGILNTGSADFDFIHNGTVCLTFLRAEASSTVRHYIVSTATASNRNGFQLSCFNSYRVKTDSIVTSTIMELPLTAGTFPATTKVDWFQKWDTQNTTANDRAKANLNGTEFTGNTATRVVADTNASNDLTIGAAASNTAITDKLVGKFSGFGAWESDLYADIDDILTYL